MLPSMKFAEDKSEWYCRMVQCCQINLIPYKNAPKQATVTHCRGVLEVPMHILSN